MISNMLYPTPHFQHLLGLVIDDLTLVSLNRGIPLERKLMTNLLAAETRGQEIDLTFKYDCVRQIMDRIMEIEYLLSFLTSCQDEIMNLIGDNTEYWLALVHYVIERCKIPINTSVIELQLSEFEIQTITLISSMFCRQIARINQDEYVRLIYKLCTEYPVILDEKVRQSIMDNPYLILKADFAFINGDPVECIQNCLKRQGLKQTLNIIKSCISDSELDATLDMIINDEFPYEVRSFIASTITRSWRQFNDKDRNLLLNAVSLLQHSDPESAHIILKNVLEKEQLFLSKDIEEIISYLISDVGIQFVQLLHAVRGTPNYSQSWICQQMNSFEAMWGLKLKQMADEMDQQTFAPSPRSDYHTMK